MKGYVNRSPIWSVPFYGATIFAVCYFKDRTQTDLTDILLIFVALAFLGISSESFSKVVPRRVRAFGIADFSFKAAAFILLVLQFPLPSAKAYWILRLCGVCVAFAASTALEIVMIKFYDKFSGDASEEQPVELKGMTLKELGKLNVFCGLGEFCPVLGGFLALSFGFTPAFYILGIPLIAVGIGALAYRTVVLIKKDGEFAKLPKIIIDDFLTAATIVLSIVFTTAELIETETGFIIQHRGSPFGTIAFLILYVATIAVPAYTNQKLGITYLKLRKQMQKVDNRQN